MRTLSASAALLLLLCTSVHAAEPSQTLTPLKDRRPAPDFALEDLDGRTQHLAAQRGKVVMVNFWATWCPPCREELPSMQRAWEMLRSEHFELLAVDVGEEADVILPFVFSTGVELQFPILLDRTGTVTQAWQVKVLPTTFLLDRQGRIAYRAVGGREWDDPRLIEVIRRLLRE